MTVDALLHRIKIDGRSPESSIVPPKKSGAIEHFLPLMFINHTGKSRVWRKPWASSQPPNS
jgi:hypothetical protein